MHLRSGKKYLFIFIKHVSTILPTHNFIYDLTPWQYSYTGHMPTLLLSTNQHSSRINQKPSITKCNATMHIIQHWSLNIIMAFICKSDWLITLTSM